jgi:hypothetical protein
VVVVAHKGHFGMLLEMVVLELLFCVIQHQVVLLHLLAAD